MAAAGEGFTGKGVTVADTQTDVSKPGFDDEWQFKHISFQEALFAHALIAQDELADSECWGDGSAKAIFTRLNDKVRVHKCEAARWRRSSDRVGLRGGSPVAVVVEEATGTRLW
jgi:hypothetical protein